MPAATRTRILDGALELLRTGGPLEVRPFALSATCGVSASLIAYHFPELEGIIAQAAIAHLKNLVPLERTLLDEPAHESRSVMSQWIRHRLAWGRSNCGAIAVLASPHAYKLERFPEWQDATRTLVDGLIPHVLSHTGTPIDSAKETAQVLHKIGLIHVREQDERGALSLVQATLKKRQD